MRIYALCFFLTAACAETPIRQTSSAPVLCPLGFTLQYDCSGAIMITRPDGTQVLEAYQVAVCQGGQKSTMGIADSEVAGGRMVFIRDTVAAGNKITAYHAGSPPRLAGELTVSLTNTAKFRTTVHQVDMTCP